MQHGIQSTVKRPDLTYSAESPHAIRQQISDHGIRCIPKYGTLKKIKDLKINWRRIRFQKFTRHTQRSVNFNNLRDLDRYWSDTLYNKHVQVATVNTRSMRNKIDTLLHLLIDSGIDILGIMETWLRNDEDDEAWLNAQGFNRLHYNISWRMGKLQYAPSDLSSHLHAPNITSTVDVSNHSYPSYKEIC